MRPRMWLTLMERTQATISFGPPFGYELCARRLRDGDGARFDLRHWRVAGVGAEMIRPEALASFVRAVDGSGFTGEAFVPSYGMAEVGLAISFAQRERGVGVDHVDRNDCVKHRRARPVSKLQSRSARRFARSSTAAHRCRASRSKCAMRTATCCRSARSARCGFVPTA